MAYDEELAERVRALVGAGPEVREQKMFGGLAFLIGGHMALAVSGRGGIMVRVDPASSDRLVMTTGAEPMEMGDRPMTGWLRVASAEVRTTRQLGRWVRIGTAYARSLPPKPARGRRRGVLAEG